MNIALIRRILRSIDENITLIYYLTLKQGYFFYILGKSDFIYKIIINKKYQSCNCEDYFKHKTLCKHICFVLFKLIKIYKINLNNYDLKMVGQNGLIETNFFKNLYFDDLDWFIFKKRHKNIKKYIKKSFFNSDYFKQFKYFYQQYYFMLYKNMENSNDDCPICKDTIHKGIKCNICKNIFHVYCLNKWFDKIEVKKCPICRTDYWNFLYKFMIFLTNKKIPKKLILIN